MQIGDSQPIIGNFFNITYVMNNGAAFSIFRDQRIAFIIIALLIVVVISGYVLVVENHESRIFYGLTLISAGALGNVCDRIVYGTVIDFLDFHFWPVFNFADISIVCGAFLLLWSSLRSEKGEKGYKQQ